MNKTLVVVINWNGGQELLDCLKSLRSKATTPTFDVLVLDNASTSGQLAQARAEFPEFHFLVLKENQYWAGGNNRAIEWALVRGYDWIVLSNSDIVVDERWFPALQQIAGNESIGTVGFKVFGESQKVPMQEFENYRARYHIENLAWTDDEFISGCFLAVRAECFRKLGGFDEVYKMYSEEHDFQFRVRLAGWKTVRCNAPIWHLSEAASRKTPIKTSYFAIRNELRYIIKFEDFAFYRILRRTARFTMDMLNPWKKVDEIDCCQRRKKPTMHPFLNLWILSQAFLWNSMNYFQTREIGRRDIKLAISLNLMNLSSSKFQ
jgi:GT2 family glycosyltransferase